MSTPLTSDKAGRAQLDGLLHGTFEVSILLKGAFALLEAASGVLLWLIGPNLILHLAAWLTQAEMADDPSDRLASFLLHWAHGFSIQTQHFYAVYLADPRIGEARAGGGIAPRGALGLSGVARRDDDFRRLSAASLQRDARRRAARAFRLRSPGDRADLARVAARGGA